ncbi:MAG: carotenoid biosynthesis protein [Alkalispirochaeta sp.]
MSELLGSGVVPPVLAMWAVVMIAVPIVAAFGPGGRAWGISFGVLSQVTVVVIVLGQSWAWSHVMAVAIVVPGLGWFAEFAGSRTGIPFGRYHYTPALQPQLHRVPVVIPLAWLMMLPPSWAVAQVLLPEAGVVFRAVVAGYAFMAWDVYLDPHLTKWGFWSWDQTGTFEGIPVVNFFGWFLWATVISAISLGVVAPPPVVAGPLVVVYTVTWLLQAGGHFVFWRWPVSGLGGFVLMGVVAVPAVWLLLG